MFTPGKTLFFSKMHIDRSLLHDFYKIALVGFGITSKSSLKVDGVFLKKKEVSSIYSIGAAFINCASRLRCSCSSCFASISVILALDTWALVIEESTSGDQTVPGLGNHNVLHIDSTLKI
jgi:hypothetical protein